ncbi:MarR family winged helix-turn-helix transcriptional regulator [Limnoglobus roseus]|uniref:MarR family transcriptional regulator n=1 Tax=Limnoglobus roseus TaxID=2598579 RepID=A0A5C1ADZ4_9BACT|nr:MarR family transcriptional regulator [Limnoglobus roseus]QEL15932.1 MarR family transcriptional regulator [Limnoglobus roseus]
MTTPTPRPAARRFDSPQQEAYLALWRTYDRLRAIEDELFAQFDLTAQQYNLLRLLQADRPAPVPVSRLSERLVSRAPDMTRILDRLETRGLVLRARSTEDRRAVFVSITQPGLELLRQIARPLAACHERQIGHLSGKELQSLIDLLKLTRQPHEADDSPWK